MGSIGDEYQQFEDAFPSRIKNLIKKYERNIDEKIIYNEEKTKQDLVLPLFRILGWDVNNEYENEVMPEDKISNVRADYGFYIKNIPKFYLEVKSAGKSLTRKDENQAINYAWLKGISWAALTNFEEIRVYNCDMKTGAPGRAQFFAINFKDYLNSSQLKLLSRESMNLNKLQKKAEDWGKTLPQAHVTERFFDELSDNRERIQRSILKLNPESQFTQSDLEEITQRLFSRLIFIRMLEDRSMSEPLLKPLLRIKETQPLQVHLNKLFRKLDNVYDAKLFSFHLCEQVEISENVIKTLIEWLYSEDDENHRYKFNILEADLLGNIYENYLSTIIQHKKSGGIYYTPKYIVDFILNAIITRLKEKEVDFTKVRILDPACGSGSFLINAFDKLLQQSNDSSYNTKKHILEKNLFGVDLDKTAIEIAHLNLFLKVAEQDKMLPKIRENVKTGNSLIDDKGIIGLDAFNWQQEFNEKFDVIIGNPPYIRNTELKPDEKIFFRENFSTAEGQFDIYQLFIEKSLSLLKSGGILGFITSNKYATTLSSKKLRKYILDNCKILSIINVSNLDIFKDADTYPYIIILEKTKPIVSHEISIFEMSKREDFYRPKPWFIHQSSFLENKNFTFNVKNTNNELIEKIKKDCPLLEELCEIREGIHTGNIREKILFDEEKTELCEKVIGGRDISRYNIDWHGKWILYDSTIIDRTNNEYGNFPDRQFFDSPKLLIRDISLRMTAVYDDSKYYALNTLYSVTAKKSDFNLKYILAILNSDLIHYFFISNFEGAHVRSNYLRFKPMFTKQIPIKMNYGEKDKLVKLVNQLMVIYKELDNMGNIHNDKRIKTEENLSLIDNEINQLVYSIYDINEEEQQIIKKEIMPKT